MHNPRADAFNAACLRAQSAPAAAQQARCFENNAATVMGIRFPNRLGIAAGFDKHGQLGRAAAALGFGCIELGSCTLNQAALLHMCDAAAHNNPAILGINLNIHDAALPASIQQLRGTLAAISKIADYISINIYDSYSQLDLEQIIARLHSIQQQQASLLQEHNTNLPMVVKLHTTLGTETLGATIKTLRSAPLAGIAIAFDLGEPVTARDFALWQNPAAQALACQQLAFYRGEIHADIALIAVGGVRHAEDYQARLLAGADLVQLHNALVFNGSDVAYSIFAS